MKGTETQTVDCNAGQPWRAPNAVYVHIPFCRHHCSYCDFAISTGKGHQKDLYIDALEAEMAKIKVPKKVQSWFWGGGTPSELSSIQILRLCGIMRQWFPLEAGGEFSLEANPDDCDPARLEAMVQGGVNRISLGVQSFQTPTLTFLDRRHHPEQVKEVVRLARREGINNISLDLIFGAPGQSLDQWKRDLDTALELEPKHFSTYGLTYEKGTPLWKRMAKNDFQPLVDSEELARYETAIDVLERAGFDHYEVSNFALPGFRCIHNEVYWANHAYYGFGMGAARYVEGSRDLNARDLDAYLQKALSGEETAFQSEILQPMDEARETLALNLRRREGARREEFIQRTGYSLESIVGEKTRPLLDKKLIEFDTAGLRLTREGRYLFDWVVARLF